MVGVKYVALVAAVAGGVIGSGLTYYFTQDKDFKLYRESGHVQIMLRSTEESLPLTRIGKDFYLGDSYHNLQGVRALGMQEGKESRPEAKKPAENIDSKVAKHQNQEQK